MTLWQKIKNRAQSWAAWMALAALIALVCKEWLGYEIPGWDGIVQALMAALVAFGVVNNPDNRGEF